MQDVCWTGQTMEGALAYLASDRIGLGGLPPDLSVSAVDLQPEPARHTQTGVLVGGDLSLRCCWTSTLPNPILVTNVPSPNLLLTSRVGSRRC